MYQVFVTGGFRTPIHSIRTVIDDRGRILQRTGLNTQCAVCRLKSTFLINYALQQVVKGCTARRVQSLGSELNLAGKTGTTNDYRDAWFAGYSGNYVSVVWVGRDDNKPIGLGGGTGALPIWIDWLHWLHWCCIGCICANARYLPVMSAYLPEEASECALQLYQQEQARERGFTFGQPQSEGLDNTQQPTTEDMENNEPQRGADTWYDRALEWF